jgi:signal transduction histidine kinase
LVAGVAHELNTPLGNSLTVASTLAEKVSDFSDEVRSGYLRRSSLTNFLSASEHAVSMLTRNLTNASELITHFKQVAVDQTSNQRRSFDLRDFVTEVVSTLQPQFKKTAHRIVVDIPRGITMNSFPGPLGQVINNIAINAMIHGFGQSIAGEIKIEAAQHDSQVRLMLSDNGRGIDPQHISSIFDPFFTTRLGQGGSGLGLHIVYSIITRVLGGRIGVESKIGKGTVFMVDLPTDAPLQTSPSLPRNNVSI